eukprot:CAMPEP_0197079724 /NCGR_PEP_ID=MMETSP1384-20130603/213769_1 /TAXON_ID=29189 /ORGANISM="Ammonia sp." /LENGTH=686 /DNA_ID=CAMNT_0042518603 /DNA_START=320 /DNA_END=2380 /DNA_ORIENTATION=+
MHANNNIHYFMGWACVGIPVMFHAWLVFLPLLQSYTFHVYYTWWRPIDPVTDFYVENVHHHRVQVSINDVYALLITSIAFFILFPISMTPKCRQKHWNITHYIHLLAALIYGIELLRTPFTAHCWYISTPFVFMYLVDRVYGIFKYRKCKSCTIVGRYSIDKDYILLLLHIPGIYQTKNSKNDSKKLTYREIGDVFYLNTVHLESCSGWKPAHPFTTFYNHGQHINMIEFTKSLRTALGDTMHKFPVLTYQGRKSVTKLELNPQELYQLDRTQSQSATLERWKLRKMNIQNINHANHNNKENSLEMKQSIENSNSLQALKGSQRNNENNNKQRDALREDMEMEEEKQNTEAMSHSNGSQKQYLKVADADHEENEDEQQKEWNVGCVMRVHHRSDNDGFTAFLQHCDLTQKRNQLITYGPYRSSFANVISELIEYRLDQTLNDNEFGQGSIVLIATGAGVGYIIEFVLWLRHKFDSDANYVLANEIRVHFSCRSIRLFQWVTDFLCEKKYENLSIYAHFTSHRNIYGYDDPNEEQENHEMDKLNERFQWVTDFLCEKKYENLSIYAHFTSHRNIYGYDDPNEEQENHEMDKLNESEHEKSPMHLSSPSNRNDEEEKNEVEEARKRKMAKKKKKKRSHAKIGRASFEDVLNESPKHSTVFFCGSPFIQKSIRRMCQELGFHFYEGHTF